MGFTPEQVVLVTILAVVFLFFGAAVTAHRSRIELQEHGQELRKEYEKQLEKLRGCYLIVLSVCSRVGDSLHMETHLSHFMTQESATAEAKALLFDLAKKYQGKTCSFEIVDLYGEKASHIGRLQRLNDQLVTFAAQQMVDLISTGAATDRSTEAWNCLHPHAQQLICQAERAIRTEEAAWESDNASKRGDGGGGNAGD